jgi:hypothetical protein
VKATKLLNSGPDDVRANLVLVGDGYTAAQQRLFLQHARTLARVIKSEPWYKRAPVLNVHALSIVSEESGTWIPYSCPARPRRTPFKSAFCGNGSMLRLMTGDMPLAKRVAVGAVPNATCTGILINHSGRGGTGSINGFWVTTGRPRWWNVALHELGHGMFGLADEYDGVRGEYRGTRELTAPNLTLQTDREKLKWKHHIHDATPIPTALHGESVPPGKLRHEVGLFEGGGRYERGVFRPALQCRMRESARPFCEVCEEEIVRILQPFTDEIPDGPSIVLPPQEPEEPHVPDEDTPVVKPMVRIEVKIGGRTITWPDTRSGTDSAIAYLRRRHP